MVLFGAVPLAVTASVSCGAVASCWAIVNTGYLGAKSHLSLVFLSSSLTSARVSRNIDSSYDGGAGGGKKVYFRTLFLREWE